MYCQNCGAEKSKKICPSCGQKKVKEIKFCKWCGSESEAGQKICVNCKEEIKPKTTLAVLGNLALVVLFIILFFRSTSAIGLMSLFAVLGIVISLPVIRNTVIQKTHTKIEKRKIAHIGRYALIVALFVACLSTINLTDYNHSINNFDNDPILSLQTMESFGDYKDAPEKVKEFKTEILEKTKTLIAEGEFDKAETYLEAVGDFEGAEEVGKEFKYQKALDCEKKYHLDAAKKLFLEIKGYKDTAKKLKQTEYGLIGNSYNFQATAYVSDKKVLSVMRRSYYSGDVTPCRVGVFQSNFPEVFVGGVSLNLSEHYLFAFDGNQMYIYNTEYDPPENIKEWTKSDLLTNIVWDGDNIVSFEIGGTKFEYETEEN